MAREHAVVAVAGFAERIGLATLSFGEDGWCSVGLDELIVNLELPGEGRLLGFHCWLGEVPEARRAEVALAIGEANYMMLGTQGATLGLRRGTGDLCLSVQVGTEALTTAMFEQVLENFANLAGHFQATLLEGAAPPAEAPPPPVPAFAGIRG